MTDSGWTHVPIPDEQAARLDDLRATKRAGTKIPSRASLVRKAIDAYLDEHEREVQRNG